MVFGFIVQQARVAPAAIMFMSTARRLFIKQLVSCGISHPVTLTAFPFRSFHTTRRCSDFHFDTHHFVQRLEREGLNRAQAEGIMSAMAEVIDESIRNMTANMVTKADQEKVRCSLYPSNHRPYVNSASIYPTSRLCSDKV
jgi:hypothetical protein